MIHHLRISRDDYLIFEAVISELYAKMIGLIGWAIPMRAVNFPEEIPVLVGRLSLMIEDSLQENIVCHALWINLLNEPSCIPIEIEVTGLSVHSEQHTAMFGIGGMGGIGAFPGGGGGGGGWGLNSSGYGGSGADGAMLIFEYSRDGRLIDVEAFVTPGAFTWICPNNVELIRVIATGGGGGGGGGGTLSMR